ncbi:MAG: universal stress protein [Thermosynechococcaceae cyanobacterium]
MPLPTSTETESEWLNPEAPQHDRPLTVLAPVYNPQTEQNLIEMAALLARSQGGQIIPLAITVARPHMGTSQLHQAMERSEELLEKARSLGTAFEVRIKPLLRIDEQVPMGICRAAQEQRADLILLGWGNNVGLRARLFGNLVDTVFWATPCPVAVARLLSPPHRFQRILVPVVNFSERVVRIVAFARLLAEATQAEITLLHIVNPSFLEHSAEWVNNQMKELIVRAHFQTPVQTLVTQASDIASEILQESQSFDLVILHSQRHQTAAEGFGLSSITSQIAQQLTCSTIVLGEAHLL